MPAVPRSGFSPILEMTCWATSNGGALFDLPDWEVGSGVVTGVGAARRRGG